LNLKIIFTRKERFYWKI